MKTKSSRLLSLDVVRGITVAGMILVNNGYGPTYEMLGHPAWNGLTLCDLVFPFFLFIMGVSIYLSYSRRGFQLTRGNVAKILRRTVLLLLIGLFINWLDKWLHTDLATSIAELRFWAVLQRIAVCYLLASLLALTVRHRYMAAIAVSLLAVYAAVLFMGHGYVNEREVNVLWQVDEALFGYDHLYHYQAVDPEGLLSTMSALANVLFGLYCAWAMSRRHTPREKCVEMFVVGTVLVFIGFALHFGMPFNKRIWSPSYACVTSGLCALLTGACMKWVDAEGIRSSWTNFFAVFGTNALVLYVASELIAIFAGRCGLSEAYHSVLASFIPVGEIASLTYATTMMLLNWMIGYVLWRRRIIIKL